MKAFVFKFFQALILTGFFLSTTAHAFSFSIDQEFQVRKLSDQFTKKYGMKINIKRENGKLVVKFWDKGFFKKDWKLTDEGARFIRKVSRNLCVNENMCDVFLKSHHVESDIKNSSKIALVKSQYKLVGVSWQILKSKVSPMSLVQMSLGDQEPLVDPEKNESSENIDVKDMNTRIEIAFTPKGEIK